jgi:hypothetical protein
MSTAARQSMLSEKRILHPERILLKVACPFFERVRERETGEHLTNSLPETINLSLEQEPFPCSKKTLPLL